MKLLSTKSMMRYLPPKGTAGLARSLVNGYSRVPFPPASTIPSTRSRIGLSHILSRAAMRAKPICAYHKPWRLWGGLNETFAWPDGRGFGAADDAGDVGTGLGGTARHGQARKRPRQSDRGG